MTGRFAPTPSGRMHLGNIYAMLAAWLSARAQGDRMILRIEDIDRPRVLRDADRWIMDDLTWLGLNWDGDPVYQSDRLDRYGEAIRALCGNGDDGGTDVRAVCADDGRCDDTVYGSETVYPCFCSRADIRAASAPQEGDGFVVYPGTCRCLLIEDPDAVTARLKAGRQHSLRLFAPDRNVTFDDHVFGRQTFNLARDLGDTVIRRADGLFAYQLAVTVDDLDMGVTDIVRGRDLLRSTALQLYIRERLRQAGWHAGASASEPEFAHLPLIDNAAGRRLAKRQRSLDMGVLRARGVTAAQVIGYCGWLLGLQNGPEPCAAADLLPAFSWNAVAAHREDRCVPDDPFTI
ncbi:glutamyl-Q tRNA(Asp) ligase [Bifidobacterium ramosum]|uniref:Glutamyl-Q tRNA(Asp) ligase n=1 Tax=Bifidobacterium ramosum TaxID=1798158 RepID=A0A6L4X1N1_9BIFI|nr:glutamyl-Q tRNA(Asp) synthetase [Bifidobacterium ramosum]KAB8288658.1 glutamyl-Q tRNA(Asp) ligase [Bifidobacterium ramosum]NEG71479.1 tRNA glutamyl-Q(34) synthetase GluQRS [Bifidobacterium ramosum]